MTLTDQMYEDVKEIWEAYTEHPFVKGIGDGSLAMEKFRYYMLQDYLYLYEYAKVFALGVVKARDHRAMRFFAEFVHNILNGEMNIHKGYMAKLGISEEEVKATKMALTNVSYTQYMLGIGYSEGVLELLVSILACAWSYQEIGQKLARLPGALEHPFYSDWIKGYASAEYAQENVELIAWINELAQNASAAEKDRLREIFYNCSRYEMQFWDMSWEMEKTGMGNE